MKELAFLLFALFTSFSAAFAQNRPARYPVGTLGFGVGLEGQLMYDGLVVAQTGVTVPGGLAEFATGQVTNVLVCGRTATGAGVLECWRNVGTSFQLHGTVEVPSRDFVGVAYDTGASRIYRLDATTSTIEWVAWTPWESLPTSGWTQYATTLDVPDLAQASERTIQLHEPGKISLQRYSDYLFDPDVRGQIYGPPGSIVWQPVPQTSQRNYLIDPTSVTDGSQTITVRGVPGLMIEVVRVLDNTVVAQGMIAPSGSVTLSASSAFVLGESYYGRRAGEGVLAEYAFECVRHKGYSESFSDGTAMQRMLLPMTFYVGSTKFALRCGLSHAPLPNEETRQYQGYLAVAAGDPSPGGPADPIMPFGANVALNTTVFLPVTGYILPSGEGFMSADVPAPTDPGLTGAVFLFQFVAIDGQSAVVSEIVGIKLRPVQVLEFGGGGSSASGGKWRDRWTSSFLRSGFLEDPLLTERLLRLRR